MWDFRCVLCVILYKGYVGSVYFMDFVGGGNLFVFGGVDDIVCVWDVIVFVDEVEKLKEVFVDVDVVMFVVVVVVVVVVKVVVDVVAVRREVIRRVSFEMFLIKNILVFCVKFLRCNLCLVMGVCRLIKE